MKKKSTKKENRWKKRKHSGKKEKLSAMSNKKHAAGKNAKIKKKDEKQTMKKTAPVKVRFGQGEMRQAEAFVLSLSRHFAFARPTDGSEDVFIPAEDLGGAFPGDLVMLSHIIQQEKGPSGRVDKVLQAGSRMLTGVIGEEDGVCVFRADTSLRYPVPVEKKYRMDAKNGDKVRAEFRFSRSGELLAQIVTVYGSGESARVCADAIIDQNQIALEFPPEVLQEASQIASEPITEEVLKGRLDLRDHSICTIDSADAKDLDDAISVSRTKNGYRLGVHIADVSHYVRPGSLVDQEAMKRGTSVYFADRVIPMLPEEISNGVCSLNAGTDKLTFTALIDLDKKGEILKYKFRKSVIRSKVRGVYSEVNAIFSGSAPKELRKKYSPVIRSLNAARELANVLKERSKRNGTVDLESTESRFTLNEKGVCIDVEPRSSGEAEQMIEQLMIAANRAAAMLAREKGLPFVYRVHEEPLPDRVDTLRELVAALGFNASPLRHKGSLKPGDFAAVMEQAVGTPSEKVLSHQLLRTMAKARYDVNPIGHFGLALEDYCHFTSPIRRYPDTSIHRILGTWLSTKSTKECKKLYEDFVGRSAKNSTDCEIRAMTAERAAEDCYMAEYMKGHIGEVYEGIISGVTMRGVFVELPNTVEGFVPLETIPNSRFEFDGMVSQLDQNTGLKLTIGQKMTARSVSSDVASGKIDFAYEGKWPPRKVGK